MQNKRGQGLSTNAIILIILGVVVLVVLIVGFTVGWGKIAPWLSKNNVQNIATACDTACSTKSTYEFCSMERKLNDGDKKIDASCSVLSLAFKEYGIKECPELTSDCKNKNCKDIKIKVDGVEKAGVPGTTACAEGIKDISSIANFEDNTNTICCIPTK